MIAMKRPLLMRSGKSGMSLPIGRIDDKNNFLDENGKIIHHPKKIWDDYWRRHLSDNPDEAEEIRQQPLSDMLDVYLKHPR